MFKLILVVVSLIVTVYAKKIVVVSDTSQGMSKAEAKEVLALTDPRTSTLYKSKDKYFGYIFTEAGRMKTEGIYVSKSVSKKRNKKFFVENYAKYFKGIKSGISKKSKKLYKQRDIVFLIDTSGSMKKNNLLENLKASLKYLVLNKNDKVRISLVTFDGYKNFPKRKNSRVILNFTSNKNDINTSLKSIKISKYDTYLGDGLNLSLDLLENKNTQNKSIFIITDGDTINDEKFALKQMQRANASNVTVKVVAVGGANVSLLRKFSSNGYVYDATSSDLKEELLLANKNDDTLIENFVTLSNRVFTNNTSSNDMMIIYSTMNQVSNLVDFYLVPNLSDGSFYKEMKKKMKENSMNINFGGLKMYIKLLGNPTAQRENELYIFWKRFIEDHNGTLARLSKDALTLEEFN
jgi:Mg-chelatase subunit ChlD